MAIAGVLLFTSVLLGVVLTRDRVRGLRKDLEHKALTQARSIAAQAEYGVLVGDTAGLRQLLEGLSHDPDLVWSGIFDGEATLLVERAALRDPSVDHTRLNPVIGLSPASSAVEGRAGPDLPSPATQEMRDPDALYVEQAGQEWLRIVTPVRTRRQTRSREDVTLESGSGFTGEDETIGTVRLLISTKRVEDATTEAIQLVAWTLLGVIGLGVMLSIPIARRLVRPVRELVSATRYLAHGEWSPRLPETHTAEISELTQAFHFMSASLKDRQAALEAANRTLGALNGVLESRQEELRFSNQELVKANALKNAFLASVSHELRTPLNSILGFTECLIEGLDGPINDEQRSSLERVQRNSRQLLEMINELLDLARIEAGQIELAITPVHLADLIQECVETVTPLLRGRSLPLRVRPPPPETVLETDRNRLRQVILNLLSNALKFTDAGEILLEVTPVGERVEIRVKDTGTGISEADLQTLFTAFRRVGKADRPGTGLGLAISRHLIEALGGRISVTSEPGVGTDFRVSLPCKNPLNAPGSPSA